MRAVGLLLVSLALAACAAPVKWQHPERTPAQAGADESACRRWAMREAELESAQRDYYGDSTAGRRGYDAQMARFSLTKRRDGLFDQCMRNQGYKPAPPE